MQGRRCASYGGHDEPASPRQTCLHAMPLPGLEILAWVRVTLRASREDITVHVLLFSLYRGVTHNEYPLRLSICAFRVYRHAATDSFTVATMVVDPY